MNPVLRRAALGLVAFGLLWAGCASAQEPVPAPTLVVGDRWVYRHLDSWDRPTRIVREILAATDERVELTQTKEGSDRVLRTMYGAGWSLEAQETHPGRIRSFEPALRFFDFPLSPGKTWESRSVYENWLGNGVVTEMLKGRVEEWENVEVPAGRFRAIKLSVEGRQIRMGNMSRRPSFDAVSYSIWYVPAIKNYVKYVADEGFSRDTYELLEYAAR